MAVLAFFGLVLVTMPLSPVSAAGTSGAATSAAPTLTGVSLSLGFSPDSLYPVSQGTPVYTGGDTLWALSGYNYSVPISLSAPGPAGAVTSLSLPPGSITPVITFADKDTDGVWNMTLQTNPGPVVVPVRFVNLAAHPVSLGPLSYALDGGNLSISTEASLGDSYDQEVCAAGSAALSGVVVPVPAPTGDAGNVTLVPGSTFNLLASGNFTKPVSFWFELYQPYALDVASANSLVVNDLLVATSSTVSITSPGTQNTTVAWSTAMRTGRYDATEYFQTTTGLQVVQSRILILNSSSWISLTNDCLPQPVTSAGISYSTSLNTGQQNWPKTVYIMYRTFGVEGVASYPVSAGVSRISFVASPWNGTISDMTVGVSPQSGVQTSQDGSSLFVVADDYPVDLSYSIGIGGENVISHASASVPTGGLSLTASVSLAKLTVNVVSNKPSQTELVVTSPGGLKISTGLSGGKQTASFLVPTGSYSLSATQAGSVETSKVSLTDGTAAQVALNFNAFTGLEILLVVTAASGVAANVLIRIHRWRGISSKVKPKRADTRGRLPA